MPSSSAARTPRSKRSCKSFPASSAMGECDVPRGLAVRCRFAIAVGAKVLVRIALIRRDYLASRAQLQNVRRELASACRENNPCIRDEERLFEEDRLDP